MDMAMTIHKTTKGPAGPFMLFIFHHRVYGAMGVFITIQ